ncbi:hypothetical protein GLOIN_2v1695250 [Rhizophagus clarus]|nr:hypothetical protein GLOIN_2v1695250 [Rhizophagus clarus]
MSKEEFCSIGLGLGFASRLADFVKEYEKKKLRSFFLYLSLSKEIQEVNKFFKHCISEILFRLCFYGTLQLDSLEAMRNEYVVALLHARINIITNKIDRELSMLLLYEISGVRSKDRVDYTIKLENAYEMNKRKRKRSDNDFDYFYGIVITGRDWHFLLYSPEKIFKVSDTIYSIKFTKKALDINSEEYTNL